MKIYQKISRHLDGIQLGKDQSLPDIEYWHRDRLKEMSTPKNARIFIPNNYTGIIVFIIETPSEKCALFVHPNLSENFIITDVNEENREMFTEYLNQDY